MNDRDRGLYLKYKLKHMDGTQADPDGDYFVLKMNSEDKGHKEASQAAIATYAAVMRRHNKKLAADLMHRYCRGLDMPIEDIEKLAEQCTPSTHDEEIDLGARVSIPEKQGGGVEGAWIQGWIWYPIEDWPEELRKKYGTDAEDENDPMD